jgi:hypothetical protein
MAADGDTTAETTSFASFNAGLFDRMRIMSRSWIERLREVHQIEQDFGARLLAAKTPAEATIICHEWMAKRLEAVASEQKAFTGEWLGLVSDTIEGHRRGVNVAEEGHDQPPALSI